jgi:hypothetical protein
MKIREILLENEEHIKTYWAIMGIDIDSYYRAFDDITKDTNIIRRKVTYFNYQVTYILY